MDPLHSLIHVLTFDIPDEARKAQQRLHREGIVCELRPEQVKSPQPGIEMWAHPDDIPDILEIVQEDEQAVLSPRPLEGEEKLVCARCGSGGVEVGGPPRWKVVLLSQVLGIPHLKRPCKCLTCGKEWSQYVAVSPLTH